MSVLLCYLHYDYTNYNYNLIRSKIALSLYNLSKNIFKDLFFVLRRIKNRIPTPAMINVDFVKPYIIILYLSSILSTEC